MTTLHLIRESSSQKDFSTYISLVSANDSIVLLDDGCYNATSHWLTKLNYKNLYVIERHASARAIPLGDNAKSITSNTLVDLICQHNNSITWN